MYQFCHHPLLDRVICIPLLLGSALISPATGVNISGREMPGPVAAELLRVIDGDTIEVRAKIWLEIDVTTRVRLAGIDAPELNGACPEERQLAQGARSALSNVIKPGALRFVAGQYPARQVWRSGDR
jgi:endonuclease YncB( thermonuclease family)